MASATLYFAATCAFLVKMVECGHCPSTSLFGKGVSFKVKTVSGKYLGYWTEPSSDYVQFHQNLSTDQYAFDWTFEKCTTGDHDLYNIKASSKDGSHLYLKCGGSPTESCNVWELNGDPCQSSDWQSWKIQDLGSHCALAHTANWGYYICEDGEGGPTTCSDMTLKSEIDMEPSNCDGMETPIGSWLALSYSSEPSDYTISVGVTHSYTNTNQATWGITATEKITAGFDIEGETGSAEVDEEVSSSFAHTYTSVLQSTNTTTQDYHLDAGQFWQFKFTFQDRCGGTVAGGSDFALTNSRNEKPCCLPGYAKNASIQHGPCLPSAGGKTYNFCSSMNNMII